jgi:hypothetical protein
MRRHRPSNLPRPVRCWNSIPLAPTPGAILHLAMPRKTTSVPTIPEKPPGRAKLERSRVVPKEVPSSVWSSLISGMRLQPPRIRIRQRSRPKALGQGRGSAAAHAAPEPSRIASRRVGGREGEWPRCDAPAGSWTGIRKLGTQRAWWVPARRLPWLRNRLNRLTDPPLRL